MSPEQATSLAQTILSNASREQADALCSLVKGLAGAEPSASAPIEDRKRYDLAYAVMLEVYPQTSHGKDAFNSFLDEPIEVSELPA